MTTVPGTGSNTDLASILAAAFDEFEMLRKAARQREDQDPDLFPAFLLAGSAAANGRDALVSAPSFPPGPQPPGPAAVLAAGTDLASAADVIAAHAAALAEQLDRAASVAVTADDRGACQDAASAALQICQLMAGADVPDPR